MTEPDSRRPAENQDAPPAAEPRAGVKVLYTFLRNSPWISIAFFLHVLAFALLSVVYIAHNRPEEVLTDMAVTVSAPTAEPTAAIEEVPEIIDRDSVPIMPDEEEGPVNPDPVYLPDAAPGRAGEITDELDTSKEAGIYNPDPEALSNLPSGATGGTPIGVGNVGHAGAGTSAYSSRKVGGGGKGGGGFGQGGGDGRGGKYAEAAVLAALDWLKRHQSPDGSWDSEGFIEQCNKNVCSGPGNEANDTGLTGLALLCFLGAGHTHEEGYYKSTVKKGLLYLIKLQEESGTDGSFGYRVGQSFNYNHACAALAMAEAYGMTGAKVFRKPAQDGINYVLKAQNPYAAWRYAYPPDGDNDSSVTGWMVMVLKSGKISKLQIDDQALLNAVSYIDEVTDPTSGRTGYTAAGESSSRLPALASTFPVSMTEALTAVGLLVRIFGGRTEESDPMIAKGADVLMQHLPVWDKETGAIDYYYWYYATLSLFQIGGSRWDKWNAALKEAVIDNQRLDKNQDEYGSWDPIDPWSTEGGRIYATTLNCLSMEVYYRYDKVFGTADAKGKTGSEKPK